MGRDPTNSSDPAAMSSTRTVSPRTRTSMIDDIVESGPGGGSAVAAHVGLAAVVRLGAASLELLLLRALRHLVKPRAVSAGSLLDRRGARGDVGSRISRDFRRSGGVTTCESQLGYPATRAAIPHVLALARVHASSSSADQVLMACHEADIQHTDSGQEY